LTKLQKEQSFYKTLLRVALPTAGANLLQNAVGLADTLMVGTLGDSAVAAVAGANRVFFIFSLLLFGLVSGGSVLAAQYWGRRDTAAVARVAGIVLRFGMLSGVLFSIAAFAFPRVLLSAFSADPEVIALGAGYLRIIAVTFLTCAFSTAYATFLRSVEKAGLWMAVQGVAFFANIGFNSIFIFGLLGAPAMGVNGAALGTLLSRLLECVVVFVYARFFNKEFRLRPGDILHTDKALLRDFLRYAGVVVVNELVWGLGNSMHSVIMGHMSTQALTASSVAATIQGMVTVAFFGLASGAAVVVGKSIGQNQFDAAKRQCKAVTLLALGVGVACAGLLLLARAFLVGAAVDLGLFRLSPGALGLIRQIMLLHVCLLPVISCNCTLIVGILRSGGDTKVSAFLDTGFMWLISLPAAALAAFVFHIPPIWVMMLLYCEELLKCAFAAWRMLRWKWMRNVTREGISS